jgi:hypothetical protein
MHMETMRGQLHVFDHTRNNCTSCIHSTLPRRKNQWIDDFEFWCIHFSERNRLCIEKINKTTWVGKYCSAFLQGSFGTCLVTYNNVKLKNCLVGTVKYYVPPERVCDAAGNGKNRVDDCCELRSVENINPNRNGWPNDAVNLVILLKNRQLRRLWNDKTKETLLLHLRSICWCNK